MGEGGGWRGYRYVRGVVTCRDGATVICTTVHKVCYCYCASVLLCDFGRTQWCSIPFKFRNDQKPVHYIKTVVISYFLRRLRKL